MTDDELKKLHIHILQMMKEVDSLFKKNGIFYVMVGGSVLGAVRHKGFIPWDDDIDICILRNDVEKAEKLLSQLENYQYETMEKHIIPDEPCGHLHYVKDGYTLETSPTIDLFALDAVPNENNKKLTKRFMFFANVHHVCVYRHVPKNRGTFRKIAVGFLLLLFPKKILDLLQEWSIKKIVTFDTKDSHWLGNVFQGQKEFFHENVYLETVDAEFEDSKFPIPKDFDTYCKKLYGNYMTLPPLEERRPKHR